MWCQIGQTEVTDCHLQPVISKDVTQREREGDISLSSANFGNPSDSLSLSLSPLPPEFN